jgi:hypothetical protein
LRVKASLYNKTAVAKHFAAAVLLFLFFSGILLLYFDKRKNSMKISLEKNLNELRNYLESRGYEIVGNNESADAYIYEKTPISQITARNFTPVSSLSSSPMLLVNSSGKSFDEIEQILNQKSYNKIF